MSSITGDKIHDIYDDMVKRNNFRRFNAREDKIHSVVLLFAMKIFFLDSEGYRSYTGYVYNEDSTFVSDFVSILSEKIPGCIIENSIHTIWRLFNYRMVTVTW
jgi:hypothetical protein